MERPVGRKRFGKKHRHESPQTTPQTTRAEHRFYFEYLNQMQNAELYDFNDMILQVVKAIETQNDLRYDFRKKYHYIMVDEFQDTNPAQMSIVNTPAMQQSR